MLREYPGVAGEYFEYSRKKNYWMILNANIFHSLARMLKEYPGVTGGYFEYSRKRNYCMILDANIFHSLARMLRGYPGRKRGGILNSLGRETIVRFQRGCPGVRGGIFWLIIFLFTRILRDVEWEEEYFELLRIRKNFGTRHRIWNIKIL